MPSPSATITREKRPKRASPCDHRSARNDVVRSEPAASRHLLRSLGIESTKTSSNAALIRPFQHRRIACARRCSRRLGCGLMPTRPRSSRSASQHVKTVMSPAVKPSLCPWQAVTRSSRSAGSILNAVRASRRAKSAARGPCSGSRPSVQAFRIVQECEQLHDLRLGTGALCQSQAVLPHPAPMPGAVDSHSSPRRTDGAECGLSS
jgi:hypothetical protein